MGIERPGTRTGSGSRGTLSDQHVVRVVPEVPSFAVDQGFSYWAPAEVGVGAIVRVPLAGRIVRGYVVGPGDEGAARLKNIRSVSGSRPVFGARLLEVLRWAARHYVAPLSVVLRRTTPPNLPVPVRSESRRPLAEAPRGPLAELAAAAAAGRHFPPHYLLGVGPGRWSEGVSALVQPVLSSDNSVLVVVPTGAELARLAEALEPEIGSRLLAVAPDASAKEATEAWSRSAAGGGFLVLGTPRLQLWPIERLSLMVVLDEGRRAMKERQTPTLHVRDVVARRAMVERVALAYVGRVPTTEVIASGTAVVRNPGTPRAWPIPEIVDRGADPPGAGLFSERVRAAIRSAAERGTHVFLFSHRHGYSAAARCSNCKELRVCPECGARPDPGQACRRCGAALGSCGVCGGTSFIPLGAGVGRVTEEARRLVGPARVGPERQVQVGTERDLAGRSPFGLAVITDADGLILGTNYRASEEALRSMVRVVSAVRRGGGRRAMVQTVKPDHPVIRALVRGDPMPFLTEELEDRARLKLPPAGELIVVEGRDLPQGFDVRLRDAVADTAAVLGPSQSRRGNRWLIQGTKLATARGNLPAVVQHARDSGAHLRIDVDPIDL